MNSDGPSSVSGMGDDAATVAPGSASVQQVALLATAPPSSENEHCWKSSPAKPCAHEALLCPHINTATPAPSP